MSKMLFQHFCGNDLCSTVDEVREVLSKNINGVNEFIISDENNEVPYMTVLINKDSAYIYYEPFDEFDSAGFEVCGENYGEDIGSDCDDITVFYTNTPTEEIEISNEYVNTKDTALNIISEFLNYDEWPLSMEDLPLCVQWEEF